MPFLILSRQGLADLRAAGPVSDVLWINPGVLTGDEIAQLQREGVTLNLLPRQVDPHDAAQRDDAARGVAGEATLWVEHAAGGAAGTTFEGTLQKAQDIARNQAARLARAAARRIRRYAAGDNAAIIVPYMSYGSADCLTVRGRVLKDEGFQPPDPSHSGLRNLVELYKRLGSDEVPGARLRASFAGLEQDIVADDSGYFHAMLRLPQALSGSGWQTVQLALLDPAPRKGQPAQAEATVLVPPASAVYGIISDIDDTVLWSNVDQQAADAQDAGDVECAHPQAVQGRHRVLPCAAWRRRTAMQAIRCSMCRAARGTCTRRWSTSWQSQSLPSGPLLLQGAGRAQPVRRGQPHGPQAGAYRRRSSRPIRTCPSC